ncbi:MFS transporter [Craurococcus roseus]|uniref:MFS transporter n=1 Tax=Craurococcus roseus TaxID=77585 RepID=A0ABN1FQD4_9PROT
MAPDDEGAAGGRAATRRLILLLGLSCFAGALASRVTDPFVVSMSEEFRAQPESVALLASAFAVPFALVQPVLGPVGDALGKRRVIRAALCLLAVFTLLAPFAPDLASLAVLRGLSGAAAGGVMPLSLATVGDAVPMRERQVALSRLIVFAIAGQVGGGALAGVLAPFLGWRGVLGLCGAVALAAVALMVFVPPPGPPEPRRRFEPVGALRRYRMLLKLPAARVLYASVLAEGVFVFGAFPYFAPVLEARGQGGVLEAGLAVAAFGCGGFLFAALARTLLARIGQGRMVVLGGALAALALVGLGAAPSAAVFVAAGLVLGLGFYMVHNTIQTRVTEVAPEARGSAVALHAFHFYVGQSLGPVAVGVAGGLLGPGAAFALAGAGMLALGLRLGRR